MSQTEKTLRYIVLCGLFALPLVVLVVSNSLFFPFITGKNFLFRILVEIITGSWLALAWLNASYRPRRSWMFGAFALFIAVMAVADLFGVNPHRSFMSNFERMEGWVTLAHLFCYLVVAGTMLHTERLWRNWFNWSLIVSLFVSFLGFLQLAHVIAINQSGNRIDARFGNSIYLAVYMLFHAFIAALLWSQIYDEKPRERGFWGTLYGAVIVIDTIILFFTATRGAMIGLILGTLVALIVLIVANPRSRFSRYAGVVIAVMIVVGGGFWLTRESALVQSIEPLKRLASISLSETTVYARFVNWDIAFHGVKEKPILGWGQENYGIVFDKYYDPRMYAQEQWFDRAHNVFLDWLVSGGILGFLSYLSLYAAFLYLIWRGRTFSLKERAILTGLIIGYAFQNITVFDNLTSYLMLIAIFAYVATREGHASKRAVILGEAGGFSKNMKPAVAAVALLLVWGSAWAINARAYAQNRNLIQGIGQQQGGPQVNLEYFKAAVASNSFGQQEAREHLVQLASAIASASSIDPQIRVQFAQLAADNMLAQEKAMPLEARFPLFMGVLFDAYGQYTSAAPELLRAHDLSPTKQSILFELGMNAEARKDMNAALQYFKQAYDLEPEYKDARFAYAAVLIRNGNMAAAHALIDPLLEAGEKPDDRIVAAYSTTGRLSELASLWITYTKLHPEDVQARFTLAAIYFAEKDNTHAIAVLEQAKIDFPANAAQVDELIKEIRSGTAKLQ